MVNSRNMSFHLSNRQARTSAVRPPTRCLLNGRVPCPASGQNPPPLAPAANHLGSFCRPGLSGCPPFVDDFARDDDLAALADPADALLPGCGGLACHAFSLSDIASQPRTGY